MKRRSSDRLRLHRAERRPRRIDNFRFGFVSCANYEQGYFSAYRHLAAEAPDLVLFLGDYIYETSQRDSPACGGTAMPRS